MQAEKVHARAGRTGSGHGRTKTVAGNGRTTAHRVDAIHNFTFTNTFWLLSCTNGEYEFMSIDGGDSSDVFYYFKGGGARYPYPKEVWSPAGALDNSDGSHAIHL